MSIQLSSGRRSSSARPAARCARRAKAIRSDHSPIVTAAKESALIRMALCKALCGPGITSAGRRLAGLRKFAPGSVRLRRAETVAARRSIVALQRTKFVPIASIQGQKPTTAIPSPKEDISLFKMHPKNRLIFPSIPRFWVSFQVGEVPNWSKDLD
jgi:hypothetical protein